MIRYLIICLAIFTSLCAALVAVCTGGCSRGARPADAIGKAAFEGRTDEALAMIVAEGGGLSSGGGTLSALVWASRGGQVATIRALIAAGEPIDTPSGVNGWSPLMHAIHKDQATAARALVEAGADVNFRAERGVTSLMLSAGQAQPEIVRMLLEHGADPRAKSEAGVTALTNGVASGNADVVRAILERAPEERLSDTMWDKAAVWLARLGGKSEILTLIGKG